MIDQELCTGHGRCYQTSPSVFIDDERGFGQVKGDGYFAPDFLEDARRAERACPERAITIRD